MRDLPHRRDSSSDDPSRYRSQSEVDAWIAKDPVERMRRHQARGLWSDDDERAAVEAIDAEIREAIAVAEAAAPVAREGLFDDVYASPPWHLAEQRADMLSRPPPTGHGAGH
ncbi:MAG: thiamine pyrophosphate-dependent enzyme [Polyangiales bacterium]